MSAAQAKSNKSKKAEGTVRIRQIKSGIGFNETQKATLKALGLGKIGRERTYPDNPQVRGMAARVSHLVVVSREG